MDEKLLALFQVSPTLVQPRLIHFCEGAWMGVEGKEREFSQVKLSKTTSKATEVPEMLDR